MSLKSLDLNLLKTLDAIFGEGGVTRAADVLGRSQPAVSNALHRLREVLKDDLVVRSAGALAFTPRAEALRLPVREALASLERSLFGNEPFNPQTATGAFRISTPDRLSLAAVPRVFERLQKHAPLTSLQVATADSHQALELLDENRTELALGWLDEKPSHMRAELLLEEHLYCVVRKNHPILTRRPYSIDAVLSFPHLVVSATGQGTAIFDDMIARQGRRREALVTVANFTTVPQLLATSNMIGVYARLAAEVFEKDFGLAKRRVPLTIGRIVTHMVWHGRNDGDARHAWLREQVRALFREF